MKDLTIYFLVLLVFSIPTFAEEPPEPVDETVIGVPDPTQEEVEELFRELEINSHEFAVVPHSSSSKDDPPNYSGKWIEEDGERVCDGYLTRTVEDAFCSKEVPAEWSKREFNHRTYYIAPIQE